MTEPMDGQIVRASLEGSLRDFHDRIVRCREGFARLPDTDGEKAPGLEMTMLWDATFHYVEHLIGVVSTAQIAMHYTLPVRLMRSPDGDWALGVSDEKGVLPQDEPSGP